MAALSAFTAHRAHPTPITLLERETPLRQMQDWAEQAFAGTGRSVVISGQAGIGKTSFLQTALERAVEHGFRVLSARAMPLETDLPFGVVRQLFEPAVTDLDAAERNSVFDEVAQLAAPITRSPETPPNMESVVAEGVAPFAALHGLYWLLANLAERRPLVLAVDDAQWADTASWRFFGYLAARLEDLPVLSVLVLRRGENGPGSGIAASMMCDPKTATLELGPLSADAVLTLTRANLSAQADGEFCRACFLATGGNPFFLREVLATLRADHIEPTHRNVDRVGEIRPATIARSIVDRIGRLGREATDAARALAVLGAGAPIRSIAGLAGQDLQTSARALDKLITAELLTSARPHDFRHPLIRGAVYDSISPALRALMHGRAAVLLAQAGRPCEELATHLLESEPAGDPWVAETLRQAARQALTKGAPELAVTYLRRAHMEPPAPDLQAELLAELAMSEAWALDSMAIEDLTRALEVTDDPPRWASLALAQARLAARQGRLPEAIATLERAIRRIGPRDREVTLQLEAELILYLFLNEPTRTSSWKRLDRFQPDDEPDGLGKRLLMADMAGVAAFRCEPAARTAALALGALADSQAMVKHAGASGLLPSAVMALMWCDYLQDAERILDVCLNQAAATGSVSTVSLLLPFRADVARRRGELAAAEAYGRQGLAIARSYDVPTDLMFAVAMLVLTLVERGELDDAAAILDQLPARAELGDQMHSAWLLFVRGCYRLARCQPADALVDLSESGKRYKAWNCVNPAVAPWRSTAALAYVALDQLDRARTFVEEELELARAFGAPRAIGIAQRAAGLLEKGRRSVELLAEAVATLKQSCATLELARAQIDYGAALRRCGQRSAAVEALRPGLDLADRSRATPLVARARAELIAAGARPRRHRLTGVEALTASEHRIAEMVAQGMSNRHIAQQLFISMKTVSIHLTHAYQKLGISSRSDLQRILASSR